MKLLVKGKNIEVSYLGKGSFAKAYRSNEDVFLEVRETNFGMDFSKSILSKAKGIYLPKLELVDKRVDFTCPGASTGCFIQVFKMPYYPTITTSNPSWSLVKLLQKSRDDAMHAAYREYREKTGERPSLTFLGNRAALLTVEFLKGKVSDELRGDLVKLLKEMVKAGSGYVFEFNKQNIGIDNKGELILRDPVYDADLVVKLKRDKKNGNGKQHKKF